MNRRDAIRTSLAIMTGTSAVVRVSDKHAECQQLPAMSPLSRPIPSSGEMLPVIGLGTWQTFDVGTAATDRAPLEEVLTTFAGGGARLIDSSPMYGQSEEVVGDLAAKLRLRPKLFIATKVWTRGKAAGITQMEQSMQKLRAQPIDLMQVHNLVDAEAHLGTLSAWKREGRIRYAGITHYTAANLDDVERVMRAHKPDFVQINYSVGERDAERRLLPAAHDLGVAVIVNRPFSGGRLIRTLVRQPLPSFAADINCTSWAQLLLKFVVSHAAITCAIPGTANASHMADNLKAAHGRLPDTAMRARIAKAAIG